MKTKRFRDRRHKLGLQIINALKGPKNCKTVTLHCDTMGFPIVTYLCYVKDPVREEALYRVLLRYKVVRRKVKSTSVLRSTLET